jgi:hypothetical protein
MRRSSLLPALAFLLTAAVALWLHVARVEAARTPRDLAPAAVYSHGKLSLTIPYTGSHAGAGHLVADLLDPEDHVLGHSQSAAETVKGSGSWSIVLTPETAIAFDELVWQRVHWRFAYNEGDASPALDGVESVSEILRRPVVHLLGQTEYLAGSEAAVRIIVNDASASDEHPDEIRTVDSGAVHLELLVPNQPPVALFSGRLDRRGTVEAQFHLPTGLTGAGQLHLVADTAIGSTEASQPIHIADRASILLTTEKPIYQPGQTIHVRALALDRAGHRAEANRALTLEVEDSRGNKVFRKITQTDNFGIASAEFALADEVNLGTYHLRALLSQRQDASPSNTAEIALNVERYVLPKFKVDVEFTPKNGKPQRDFRPGEHVTGTVRANYFFGKPVDHAEIAIKLSVMDVALFDAAVASGKTDAEGVFKFDLQLPGYFAGKPLAQGAARALVEASVKDSAQHTETRGEPITISQSSLLLLAVPESGALIPNLENQVFLLTSYPDGTPAATTLLVRGKEGSAQRVETDAGGVGVFRLHAGDTAQMLQVEADDHHGNHVSLEVPLQTRGGSDQILLRTNRAVLKAGDRLDLEVLSTRSRGSAYVDLLRNGQTILTRDVDLENGRAQLSVTATPEMAGTLDVDAYLFGSSAEPVADHRLVFVEPADELHIETVADAAVYKPGAEARVRFHVTNARGEGVSAALGVQAVDEAVFALAEKQPGFAKVFFYLEQEVMKPRFEIHSLSLESAVERESQPRDGGGIVPAAGQDSDLEARALFSATEYARPHTLDVQFGRTLPQDHRRDFEQRYRAAFRTHLTAVLAAMPHPAPADPAEFKAAFLKAAAMKGLERDAWGTPLEVDEAGWFRSDSGRYYIVHSAGPDQRMLDADDLTLWLRQRSQPVTQRDGKTSGVSGASSIQVQVEHDRGPVNGLAEVTGTVTDPTGAAVPRAQITLRRPGAETRIVHSDLGGNFTLAGLAPGEYQAAIASNGFKPATAHVHLAPRDRALLTAKINVGDTTATVDTDLTDAPVTIVDAVSPIRLMNGRGGGVGGGVFGAAAGGPVPMPMAAPMAGAVRNRLMDSEERQRQVEVNASDSAQDFTLRVPANPAKTAEPHVRSYFPEALYINPEIVTDGHGDASITIPIADSITTWRMAMLASTQSGALGSGTSALKVFQDFFVDLDLPVTLTQGDQVSLPVAVYNYAGHSGQVALKLKQEDWFTLQNDSPEKSLAVQSGQVGGSQFTLEARRIGKFKLTLTAHMPGENGQPGRDDIVVREIEVIPNGREQNLVYNGRLDGGDRQSSAQQVLTFPAESVPDATTLFVRLYPGPLSQLVEGMDSILRMPYGCFEQTSSATYPNILALDYMKQTKKLTPEIHAKAEGFIANGYQRLLTYEVPGGGFSWFGKAPANKILTAYGLMEFHDMARVAEVDPRLIARTAQWLATQQQPDGSWKPDTQFINEGATNRFNTNVLRITAYVGWSLANIGYQGPAVEKAKNYVDAHTDSNTDPYTLAVIANFAVDYKKDRDFTRRAMQALLDAKSEQGETVSWTAEETNVYGRGDSAAIETTGLAAQALLKWGQEPATTRKALTYLAAKKQADGTWGTTQATIMALRALLLASEVSSADVRGTVEILVNGKTAETLHLNTENSDLLHQFVVKNIDPHQPAQVELRFQGSGDLAYQIAGRYFLPWTHERPEQPALAISVAYDRTRLAENDIATATATIHNNLNQTANMVMVDLGIPPGFELLSEDLEMFEERTANAHGGKLEKFSQTATQAILYFDGLRPMQTVTVRFRLRAKYPIRAKTFASRVYEYYTPEVNATALPIELEVAGK